MSPNSSMCKPPPLKLEKKYSLPPEKIEVIKSLESWASQQVLPMLKPVEQSWQPQDFLPDSSLPLDEFTDQVKALRDRTAGLSDEYFVVLVGDMITEDGLPMYQTLQNNIDGVRDMSGSSQSPWAIWTRSWTAEENRHADLLRSYLYLSGRVDMRMIEKTVHYLIQNGTVSSFTHTRFVIPSLKSGSLDFITDVGTHIIVKSEDLNYPISPRQCHI